VGSILKYRSSGESVQTLSGQFVDFDPAIHRDGFLLADCSGQSQYFFEENTVVGQFSFSKVEPYCISEDSYLITAEHFLNELRERQLGKAVLSRIEKVNLESVNLQKWIFDYFDLLESTYPKAFVYLFSDERLGTWIGATPELLLTAENGQAQTMSLAGTLKKDNQQEWTAKEYSEQAMVTQFIVDTLSAAGIHSPHLKGPYTNQAGPVCHLRTDIAFPLRSSDAIKLVGNLHPTPAVSGLPRMEALQLIAKYEAHERLFYTGFLGRISPEKTELFVNLRCAQLVEGAIYLYLGGGFTVDSVPSHEWQETVNKSKTLRAVIEQL
jgi:isochorismate synthase